MDSSLKQRLVGATVLVALAVIFLPMLVKGPAPDSGVSDVSLQVPAEPRTQAGAAEQTVELPLALPGAMPQGGAVGMPDATKDDPGAPAAGGLFPAVAAGDYVVSFGSYANTGDADRVIAALASAELPAYREATQVNGREAQRVRIGPFADRAVAESARLRAGHVNDRVDAKVVVLDAARVGTNAPASVAVPAPAAAASKPQPLPSTAPASTQATTAATAAPASPKPPVAPAAAQPPAAATPPADTSKTGFAVQIGAFAAAGEATALRDRLRGAGFNAFTDTVNTDKGVLTRVRVGPAMNRAEADALKASVKAKLGLDGMVRPHP